jgi:hypothetical protein
VNQQNLPSMLLGGLPEKFGWVPEHARERKGS